MAHSDTLNVEVSNKYIFIGLMSLRQWKKHKINKPTKVVVPKPQKCFSKAVQISDFSVCQVA